MPSLTPLSHYSGMGSSFVSGAFEPPDPQGAVGPSSVVETTNAGISIYSPKGSGSNPRTDDFNDFFFTKGKLPHISSSDSTFDPFVLYDSQVQRFMVGLADNDSSNTKNGSANALLLAVSKTSNPTSFTTSSWYFYEIDTTESTVSFQDYPGNPGYNADALIVPFVSFSGSSIVHTYVNAISINALVNGVPLSTSGASQNVFQTDMSALYPRPATMPDSSPGVPMWMVSAFNGGNPFTGSANTLDVIEMTNVLSPNPTYTTTTLTVNPYYSAVNAKDPGGAIDSSAFSAILQVGEQSNLLAAVNYTSDAAGDTDMVNWYELSVAGGTPSLVQQGTIGGTPGVYDAYPGIAINPQGDIATTYIQSGTAPGMFESMYIDGRKSADPAGTMETPVLVQAGTAAYNFTGFSAPRQGDMSRVDVDANGSFWAFSQWTDQTQPVANWNTAVANFTVGPPIFINLTGATEGVPFTNVPVATFIDSSGVPVGSYSATINWGDGTATSGTVVSGSEPGTFVILGSHTYINAGNYTLTASVSNGSATLGPVGGIVHVADAPLQGFTQALTTVTAGFVSNGLVGIFTDTDSTLRAASQYTATITWNEGNGLTFSSTGTITHLFGNTFAVYGSSPFSFPYGGLFTIRVVVRDGIGGGTVTINSALSVANNTGIPPLIPEDQADTGPFNAQFVTLEDALTNLLNAERLFMFAIALGTPKEKQGTFGNLVNALLAYETAIVKFDMTLPGS